MYIRRLRGTAVDGKKLVAAFPRLGRAAGRLAPEALGRLRRPCRHGCAGRAGAAFHARAQRSVPLVKPSAPPVADLGLPGPPDGSALGRLGRKVVTWWPADQDADEQHEADEGRARVAVAEQYRPQYSDRAYREHHSGQRYGGGHWPVQQVADRAGRAAPSADGHSAAN
jgi:hypothetical protein